MDTVIEKLKSKNLKITPQRLAVFNALYNSKDHPSADCIHKKLEPDWPTLSLATVYKTLEALRDSGLLTEISAYRDRMRYDANTEPHCHLICVKCGFVADYLPIARDEDEIKLLEENMDFIQVHKEVNFYGKCGNCGRGDSGVR